MAGGFVVASGNKIKGGRWTVFRFFLVSVAFTSAWVAVSSQLGYYRQIHGPAVLLQLNIAYFMPSIPLLIFSAFLDKPLEERLGVAKTILCRLLVGLLGYAAVCIWFPFMPEKIWFLLGAVVALGLFSGIAFSASYQLVARFANKNVIALGLGCSASGPLVLLLQLALNMGPTPTRRQQIFLFEIIGVIIAGGLWATVSLLVRHWRSIEAHASRLVSAARAWPASAVPLDQQLRAYVQRLSVEACLCLGNSPMLLLLPLSPIPSGDLPSTPSGGGSGGGQLQLLAATVWKQRSLPPLAAYNSLEPYQTFLSTDYEIGSELPISWSDAALQAAGEVAAAAGGGGGDAYVSVRERQGPGEWQPSPEASSPEATTAVGSPGGHDTSKAPSAGQALALQVHNQADTAAADSELHKEGLSGGGSASWQALRLMWPPLAALSLSSTIALILFPLFTYVPTSGLLGETLPKVIFFVRIFADVLGRFLPRLGLLASRSPYTPLAVASLKLAGVPLFLLYLKSPKHLHSDVAVVLFVTMIWVLGGYINTMSNMLAPKLVPPQLKGTAAGLMAIAYQAAHFLGLAIATLTAFLMFGSIGVD
ncbi:hypothetical protein CHLNCDRAFT_140764 [Chlorella variabilis]|uniref:Major facilitator superfamily (MFS) profile domain-containing protein n=1 Tax=Chlorella variabilis TaxID=554065 RepID=E1Z656_CHLVA|nr:hypothetical protein CHLNCDRAFT_140764 [Chlorella variabilis]EFN58589.1 hypothetical protein CHLNCDRAFT_140764 [Chlorella variabilis]|eukprot:XP_005850691.1 hypothetical protein CHLNCDRAFT_140764 [Chlorella variabilis]